MADEFPDIPTGYAIPLVDTDTRLLPELTNQALTDYAATQVDDTGTDLGAALSATIALTGAPQARDAHNYVWIAGVMRNDGTGWAMLPYTTNHRPINVDSVEVIGGNKLRVNYAAIGATMTVYADAQPDETLMAAGFRMGCSVTPTYTDITIWQDIPEYVDYIYYDTGDSQWHSQLGVMTITSFSAGVLTLTHPSLPGNSSYSVQVTPRSLNWQFVPRAGSPAVNGTTVALEVADTSPAIQGEIQWDGSAWVVPSGWSVDFTAGVLTVTHPTIGPLSSQRFTVAPRNSSYSVELSGNSSPMTTTSIQLRFRDGAGAAATILSTSMRFWLQRGGGPVKVNSSTGQSGMAFWIRCGGGRKLIDPNTIDTTAYPLSNIWFHSIQGLEGGA